MTTKWVLCSIAAWVAAGIAVLFPSMLRASVKQYRERKCFCARCELSWAAAQAVVLLVATMAAVAGGPLSPWLVVAMLPLSKEIPK